MKIDVFPEFGYEMVCSAPYAYWLHQRGELEKVTTCKGMEPFYYFCNNVEEKYNTRSIDNRNNGVQNLPNNWIHHNAMAVLGKDYPVLSEEEKAQANGVLDYRQWTPPPYKDHYYDPNLNIPSNIIVISNRFNYEHGEYPIGYFDIKCLYEIFNTLTSKGYNIVYKRPRNIEFANDPNEKHNMDIKAEVENVGVITDFDLVNYFDNVYLLDDLIEQLNTDYNTGQLQIFSHSKGFITMGGGSSTLCSYFKVPVIIYVNTSRDVWPGYFEGDSYFKKLSGAPIYPIIDKKEDILKRGFRDYSLLYSTIEKTL